MNLFWKKLFGGITPTAKLEKKEAELIEDMKRYDIIGKSAQLQEYYKLFHVVKSAGFQENRNILKNRKYKDTEEYKSITEYNKLKDSNDIKTYYKVLESKELEQYLAFSATPQFEDLGDKIKVKESEKLTKLSAFKHSNEYKTYVRFHDSFVIREFEKLKAIVTSPEFVKSNDFWANNNRWHQTPEYQTEVLFNKLQDNEDVKFYINQKAERFTNYRTVNQTFKDEFNSAKIDESKWSSGFNYKNPAFIQHHSFANEKHANNAGKNTTIEHSCLKISTKQEKITSKAWHPKKGFIQKEYEYTSDVLQTGKKFNQKKGVIRAKIKCSGKLHHCFWLGAENKLPFVSIFHFDGKSITVGNTTKDKVDGAQITGINPSEFYIYSLMWTEREMVWYINNVEIHRTNMNLPKEEMYLGFNSFISEKQKGSTGNFEIDWVRVYAN